MNKDPYGEGWLIRVRLYDAAEPTACSTPTAYGTHVAGL